MMEEGMKPRSRLLDFSQEGNALTYAWFGYVARMNGLKPKPIRVYLGFKVYVAKKDFKGFVVSNPYTETIVVSPSFLKLNDMWKHRIIRYEIASCWYFKKTSDIKKMPKEWEKLEKNLGPCVGISANEFVDWAPLCGVKKPISSEKECNGKLRRK